MLRLASSSLPIARMRRTGISGRRMLRNVAPMWQRPRRYGTSCQIQRGNVGTSSFRNRGNIPRMRCRKNVPGGGCVTSGLSGRETSIMSAKRRSLRLRTQRRSWQPRRRTSIRSFTRRSTAQTLHVRSIRRWMHSQALVARAILLQISSIVLLRLSLDIMRQRPPRTT